MSDCFTSVDGRRRGMKIGKVLFLVLLVLCLTGGIPRAGRTEVMMNAVVSGLGFGILPSAQFTLDDWLSNPNLWTITIFNSSEGNKTVNQLVIHFSLSNPAYGVIVEGDINVIGTGSKYFFGPLGPNDPPCMLVNTMFTQTTNQVTTKRGFLDSFVNEAQRIGYLPEGTYSFEFYIDSTQSWYADKTDPVPIGTPIVETIDIKNPGPPELVTPDQNDDDVQIVPRFTWTSPMVTDFSQLKSVKRKLNIFYTIKLWKMFESDGRVLDQETAIARIPIWEVKNLTGTSLDFRPNESREELISGRRYCWQVQAFDGTGRPISQTNNGKSDVWPFTIKFTPLVINEPLLFYPLRFSWTPAQSGGKVVLYDVYIADNADFSGAYIERGVVSTSYTYPGSARLLRFGVGYSIKVQATDDAGVAIGQPVTTTFTLPSLTVTLSSPSDGEVVSTKAPTFSWKGEAGYHVVTVLDQQNNKSYRSSGIEGTSWTYEGEELRSGITYSWSVTPSNQQGEPVGEPSNNWTFTIPSTDQVTVVGPINARIETVFPQFSWNRLQSATGGNVVYRINIQNESGDVIHSADIPGTSFTYPKDATGLEYGKRYTWSVGAIAGDAEIGRRSNPVWFVTPFVQTAGQEVTITEMEQAIKLVLGDYPQFEKFKEMVLSGIIGPSGSLTPVQLMEYIEKFKIVNVTAK